jgi:hypothetical protein
MSRILIKEIKVDTIYFDHSRIELIENSNQWNKIAAVQRCLLRQGGNACIKCGSGQKENFEINQYVIQFK